MFDISLAIEIVEGYVKEKKMLFLSDFDYLMINDELRWHVFKCFDARQ